MKGKDLVEKIIEWSASKKGLNIKCYDLTAKSSYTDYAIIVEGSSDLHLNALAEYVIEESKKSGIYVNGKEGMKNSSWILVDFVDVVLHVMTSEMREYYSLDSLFIKIQNDVPLSGAEETTISNEIVEEVEDIEAYKEFEGYEEYKNEE